MIVYNHVKVTVRSTLKIAGNVAAEVKFRMPMMLLFLIIVFKCICTYEQLFLITVFAGCTSCFVMKYMSVP